MIAFLVTYAAFLAGGRWYDWTADHAPTAHRITLIAAIAVCAIRLPRYVAHGRTVWAVVTAAGIGTVLVRLATYHPNKHKQTPPQTNTNTPRSG